jgi:FdhD protein
MSTSEKRQSWRFEAGLPLREAGDDLAAEEPLEIRVRGRSIAITMRTPGNDDELATGFLLTEGIIGAPGDVVRIEPCTSDEKDNVVNVTLAPEVTVDFERLTRHVFTSSSCGLCGKASIEAVRTQFGPVVSDTVVTAATMIGLSPKLRAAQPTFDRTGGLHAAAVFDAAGELVVSREDIGRHNAVDKVLGYGLMHGLLPFDRHVLLVSGRVSFEIMLKALAGRVPIVAAISAASNLAAQFATENDQTLVGFLRDGRMNIYANPRRIEVGAVGNPPRFRRNTH